MRLIDANGSYTLNASDNTGYSLCFGGGIISVADEYGHIVAEFFADDAPTIEAKPVNNWIPVTERMPEWLDHVIVHYENGNVRVAMMSSEKRFSCEGLYGKVTHWMPLPTPPVTE